jgi:hypothetical protein
MLEDVLLDRCGVFMILLKSSTCFVGVVTSFTEISLPLSKWRGKGFAAWFGRRKRQFH